MYGGQVLRVEELLDYLQWLAPMLFPLLPWLALNGALETTACNHPHRGMSLIPLVLSHIYLSNLQLHHVPESAYSTWSIDTPTRELGSKLLKSSFPRLTLLNNSVCKVLNS
ncbi:hypothetical protein ACFX13_028438 [Malus domestica]